MAASGARERYASGVPAGVEAQIAHELALIEELRSEMYFLTVHDIVRNAREQGLLCQGRGSAANSAVCCCLCITAIDPAESQVLRERQRMEVLQSRLLAVWGQWQRMEDPAHPIGMGRVCNVIAKRVEDLSPFLGRLGNLSRDFH